MLYYFILKALFVLNIFNFFPYFVGHVGKRLYEKVCDKHLHVRNTRKRCEICLNLTLKTPERCQRRRSGAFIVNSSYLTPFSNVAMPLNR